MKTQQGFLLVMSMLVLAPAFAAPEGDQVVLKPEELKAMSTDTMLQSGDAGVKIINDRVTAMMAMLGDARESKDAQRMNCLSDILTTMKGLARLAEQNNQTLRERVAARDRTASEHEFVKMMIARNKVIQLHAQGKGCVGMAGETIFEGEPLVERLFDKDMPLESGSENLWVPVITTEPPPSASPYY